MSSFEAKGEVSQAPAPKVPRMVERVARVIYGEAYPKFQFENDAQHIRDYYRETARKVIAAMREPTDPMICAVLDLHDSAPRTFRVSEDWRVMIDEALR